MHFVYGWDIAWHRIGTVGHSELWTDYELSLGEVEQIMAGRLKQTGRRTLSPWRSCKDHALWSFELWQVGKDTPRVLKLTRLRG